MDLIFIIFSEKKSFDYLLIFEHQQSLKTTFKIEHLNLCGQEENLKCLWCSRKTVVKVVINDNDKNIQNYMIFFV